MVPLFEQRYTVLVILGVRFLILAPLSVDKAVNGSLTGNGKPPHKISFSTPVSDFCYAQTRVHHVA